MTDLFILLAAVTVICTGAAIPCFFKSSRNTAGFLILTAAVLAVTAACFATPVKECFASLTVFDLWYYAILFAAAFLVSLFYQLFLGIAVILYALWCAFFLIILLPEGYSPSASVGEITVRSSDDGTCMLEKVAFSPYQLLPFSKIWYRLPQENQNSGVNPKVMSVLVSVGTLFSSEQVILPTSTTYPHVYLLSIDADGSPSFETVF